MAHQSLCWTCVHTLTWSVAPIQESLEFTDTSGTALGKEAFNSANSIFSLAIALRVTEMEVTCSKSHVLANFLNSDDAKHGLSSVTKVSGTPYRLNIAMRPLITTLEVSAERVNLNKVTEVVSDYK